MTAPKKPRNVALDGPKAPQATKNRQVKRPETRTAPSSAASGAPRLRLKLSTVDDVKAELARIYREGKAGVRDVSEVSKLGNLLNLLGRLIVDNELAARIEALEEQQQRKAR